jgi:hypothetical protein
MPPIISRYGHGTQVYDPPCLTQGATLYCFVVKSNTARMEASVDSYLNRVAPSRVHFTPVGDSVLFFVLRASSLRSADADQPSGFVDDYESAPCMPLLMKVTDGSGDTDSRLVNWMPYVVIADAMGCIAGRELFGFQKGLGQFYVPTLSGPLDTWEVRAQVFRELDPKVLVEWAPLYTIRRTSGHDNPVEDMIEAFDDVFDVIRSLILNWSHGLLAEVGFDLLSQIIRRAFPVVNLKQFPDVEDATKACYQEICTADMTLTKIRRGGRLKGDFEIEIPKYESHDVAGDLGLAGSGPVHPVEFGLFIDMDFTVPVGKRVWRST